MQSEMLIDDLDAVTGGEIKCNRHTVAIDFAAGCLLYTSPSPRD